MHFKKIHYLTFDQKFIQNVAQYPLHHVSYADKKIEVAMFVLFVLLLYVPSQQLWSLRDGQFTQPHFFLGRLEQAVNQ